MGRNLRVQTKRQIADAYVSRLTDVLNRMDRPSLDLGVEMVAEVWCRGKQIITLGNGGSSLTALHFINDWNKSVFLSGNRPFRGRSLVDNIGLLMSYANDISFQDIFIEQLRNLLEPGDLVIGISGSGNSENVIRAMRFAVEKGATTIGLSGYDGGKLRGIVHHSIWVPVNDMQITEDIHMMFGHMVMQALCSGKEAESPIQFEPQGNSH